MPDNSISKDIFDNVSVYIIPKAQLQRSTMTVFVYIHIFLLSVCLHSCSMNLCVRELITAVLSERYSPPSTSFFEESRKLSILVKIPRNHVSTWTSYASFYVYLRPVYRCLRVFYSKFDLWTFLWNCRTLKDYKILGFPVKIDNKKYARNAFYFNLCFVCDAEARTVHYEPVVKKMSDFLVRKLCFIYFE